MVYLTAPVSITLNNHWPSFQGHAIVWRWISNKRLNIRWWYAHSNYGRITITITILRSPKQQIWLRTALCGGWCRHMALRNRELHARNDDDDDSYYGKRTGNRTQAFEYQFEWPSVPITQISRLRLFNVNSTLAQHRAILTMADQQIVIMIYRTLCRVLMDDHGQWLSFNAKLACNK